MNFPVALDDEDPAEVASDDRLLDLLGSSHPQVTDELSEMFVAWRNALESRPMRELVLA